MTGTPVARTVRSVFSGSFVVGALAFPLFLWAGTYSVEFPRTRQDVETLRYLGLAALLSAALAAVGTSIWAKRSLRSEALKRSLLVENFLLRAPLSASGFWTRPEIAGLLTPAPRAEPATAKGDPSPSLQAATELPTIER